MGRLYGAFVVGFENIDFAFVFVWFLEPRFGVGFENVDFAFVFVWFLEGHLVSFGVILGLSGSSRSQLESSEGPLAII